MTFLKKNFFFQSEKAFPQDTKVANKLTKRWSASLVTREVQMKTTIR